MASAEHEPITGFWGGAPGGFQGQNPWSGGQGGKAPLKLFAPLKLKAFSFRCANGGANLTIFVTL